MSVQSVASILFCFDPRIQMTMDVLIHRNLGLPYGSYDPISVAGGAMLDDYSMVQIRLSVSIRHAGGGLIVLVVHEDCGMGASLDDLLAAMAWARKEFPHHAVRGFMLKQTTSPDVWTIEEISLPDPTSPTI